MMKNTVKLGKNRTGIALSPIDKREMLEVTELTHPPEGDASRIAETRSDYLEREEPIGTVPPPATVRGIVSTGAAALKNASTTVLVDKLSERLGFERMGTRLYETVIQKAEASEPMLHGPTVVELAEIRADELAHFELVRRAMIAIGADPTALTPSADMAAVSSLGVLQVVADPRTSLKQCLEAMLIAELVDNDGWVLLVQLTREAGLDTIAADFEAAAVREADHLAKLRAWVTGATLAAAKMVGDQA